MKGFLDRVIAQRQAEQLADLDRRINSESQLEEVEEFEPRIPGSDGKYAAQLRRDVERAKARLRARGMLR